MRNRDGSEAGKISRRLVSNQRLSILGTYAMGPFHDGAAIVVDYYDTGAWACSFFHCVCRGWTLVLTCMLLQDLCGLWVSTSTW